MMFFIWGHPSVQILVPLCKVFKLYLRHTHRIQNEITHVFLHVNQDAFCCKHQRDMMLRIQTIIDTLRRYLSGCHVTAVKSNQVYLHTPQIRRKSGKYFVHRWGASHVFPALFWWGGALGWFDVDAFRDCSAFRYSGSERARVLKAGEICEWRAGCTLYCSAQCLQEGCCLCIVFPLVCVCPHLVTTRSDVLHRYMMC